MRATWAKLALCIVLMIVALYAHYPTRTLWSEAFVVSRTFSPGVEWWDTGSSLWWLFEFLWGAMIGIVVALIAGASSSIRWAAVCGVLVALTDFLLSSHYFYTDSISARVWAYGTYLMPVTGAVIAASTLNRIRTRTHEGTTHAA
jgi:hypothetical protein